MSSSSGVGLYTATTKKSGTCLNSVVSEHLLSYVVDGDDSHHPFGINKKMKVVVANHGTHLTVHSTGTSLSTTCTTTQWTTKRGEGERYSATSTPWSLPKRDNDEEDDEEEEEVYNFAALGSPVDIGRSIKAIHLVSVVCRKHRKKHSTGEEEEEEELEGNEGDDDRKDLLVVFTDQNEVLLVSLLLSSAATTMVRMEEEDVGATLSLSSPSSFKVTPIILYETNLMSGDTHGFAHRLSVTGIELLTATPPPPPSSAAATPHSHHEDFLFPSYVVLSVLDSVLSVIDVNRCLSTFLLEERKVMMMMPHHNDDESSSSPTATTVGGAKVGNNDKRSIGLTIFQDCKAIYDLLSTEVQRWIPSSSSSSSSSQQQQALNFISTALTAQRAGLLRHIPIEEARVLSMCCSVRYYEKTLPQQQQTTAIGFWALHLLSVTKRGSSDVVSYAIADAFKGIDDDDAAEKKKKNVAPSSSSLSVPPSIVDPREGGIHPPQRWSLIKIGVLQDGVEVGGAVLHPMSAGVAVIGENLLTFVPFNYTSSSATATTTTDGGGGPPPPHRRRTGNQQQQQETQQQHSSRSFLSLPVRQRDAVLRDILNIRSLLSSSSREDAMMMMNNNKEQQQHGGPSSSSSCGPKVFTASIPLPQHLRSEPRVVAAVSEHMLPPTTAAIRGDAEDADEEEALLVSSSRKTKKNCSSSLQQSVCWMNRFIVGFSNGLSLFAEIRVTGIDTTPEEDDGEEDQSKKKKKRKGVRPTAAASIVKNLLGTSSSSAAALNRVISTSEEYQLTRSTGSGSGSSSCNSYLTGITSITIYLIESATSSSIIIPSSKNGEAVTTGAPSQLLRSCIPETLLCIHVVEQEANEKKKKKKHPQQFKVALFAGSHYSPSQLLMIHNGGNNNNSDDDNGSMMMVVGSAKIIHQMSHHLGPIVDIDTTTGAGGSGASSTICGSNDNKRDNNNNNNRPTGRGEDDEGDDDDLNYESRHHHQQQQNSNRTSNHCKMLVSAGADGYGGLHLVRRTKDIATKGVVELQQEEGGGGEEDKMAMMMNKLIDIHCTGKLIFLTTLSGTNVFHASFGFHDDEEDQNEEGEMQLEEIETEHFNPDLVTVYASKLCNVSCDDGTMMMMTSDDTAVEEVEKTKNIKNKTNKRTRSGKMATTTTSSSSSSMEVVVHVTEASVNIALVVTDDSAAAAEDGEEKAHTVLSVIPVARWTCPPPAADGGGKSSSIISQASSSYDDDGMGFITIIVGDTLYVFSENWMEMGKQAAAANNLTKNKDGGSNNNDNDNGVVLLTPRLKTHCSNEVSCHAILVSSSSSSSVQKKQSSSSAAVVVRVVMGTWGYQPSDEDEEGNSSSSSSPLWMVTFVASSSSSSHHDLTLVASGVLPLPKHSLSSFLPKHDDAFSMVPRSIVATAPHSLGSQRRRGAGAGGGSSSNNDEEDNQYQHDSTCACAMCEGFLRHHLFIGFAQGDVLHFPFAAIIGGGGDDNNNSNKDIPHPSMISVSSTPVILRKVCSSPSSSPFRHSKAWGGSSSSSEAVLCCCSDDQELTTVFYPSCNSTLERKTVRVSFGKNNINKQQQTMMMMNTTTTKVSFAQVFSSVVGNSNNSTRIDAAAEFGGNHNRSEQQGEHHHPVTFFLNSRTSTLVIGTLDLYSHDAAATQFSVMTRYFGFSNDDIRTVGAAASNNNKGKRGKRSATAAAAAEEAEKKNAMQQQQQRVMLLPAVPGTIPRGSSTTIMHDHPYQMMMIQSATVTRSSYLPSFGLVASSLRLWDRDAIFISDPSSSHHHDQSGGGGGVLNGMSYVPGQAFQFPLLDAERCSFIQEMIIGDERNNHYDSIPFFPVSKNEWNGMDPKVACGCVAIGTSFVFPDQILPRTSRFVLVGVSTTTSSTTTSTEGMMNHDDVDDATSASLVQLYEKDITGALTCMSFIPGQSTSTRIALGVNGGVMILRWHPVEREFVSEGSISTGQLTIKIRPFGLDGRILVGDLRYSVSILKLNMVDGQLMIESKDNKPREVMDMISMEVQGVNTNNNNNNGGQKVTTAAVAPGRRARGHHHHEQRVIIIADEHCNLIAIQPTYLPSSLSSSTNAMSSSGAVTTTTTTAAAAQGATQPQPQKISRKMQSHATMCLGERVTAFCKGSLTTAASNSSSSSSLFFSSPVLSTSTTSSSSSSLDPILYGTVNGSLGIILAIDPHVALLLRLVEQALWNRRLYTTSSSSTSANSNNVFDGLIKYKCALSSHQHQSSDTASSSISFRSSSSSSCQSAPLMMSPQEEAAKGALLSSLSSDNLAKKIDSLTTMKASSSATAAAQTMLAEEVFESEEEDEEQDVGTRVTSKASAAAAEGLLAKGYTGFIQGNDLDAFTTRLTTVEQDAVILDVIQMLLCCPNPLRVTGSSLRAHFSASSYLQQNTSSSSSNIAIEREKIESSVHQALQKCLPSTVAAWNASMRKMTMMFQEEEGGGHGRQQGKRGGGGGVEEGEEEEEGHQQSGWKIPIHREQVSELIEHIKRFY